MKKNAYKVIYKHGFVGDSIVMAFNKEEAIKEAISFCRFRTSCIPSDYGPDDIIKSIYPIDMTSAEAHNCQFRSVTEYETRCDYPYDQT